MPLSEFFFDRVTEEIRLQIGGVAALTERLGRQHLSADARACVDGVEEAAQSIARLLTIANDLRHSNVQSPSLAPAPQPLREFMDEVQARWLVRVRDSGVALLVSYEGDPAATGMIDAQRLHQVFDGLISQAVSGVQRGAIEASLHVSAEGEALRLEGRIRGAGEARGLDDLGSVPQVAERFGLEAAIGAAVGQRVLQAMGGALATEANAGGGVTATFVLKAPRACAQAAPVAEPSGERAAHVLIVDDNATNRMVAETLCEMFDCTAETAVDGVEAVELAMSGRFDLILMDIKMPRMDGVAATRAIRALPGPAAQTPIIALTANADPEDAAGYLAAGMISVVEKPMKPENLLRALQQALGSEAAAA